MKPPRAQTYYELLEVSVSATTAEIRFAYERLMRLCDDDQLALYGLASAEHAKELRARLTEAMEYLTDDDLRPEYDKSIGLPPREPKATAAPKLELAPPPAPSAPEPPPPPPPVPMVAAPPEPPPLVVAPTVTPEPSPPRAIAVVPPPVEVSLALAPPRASPAAPPPSAPGKAPPFEVPPGADLDGALLRRAREHKGLSLATLAERTRIGSKHLENVEAEVFTALPAPVYVRGFLMALCKELGLDGLSVSKAYLARLEAARAKH